MLYFVYGEVALMIDDYKSDPNAKNVALSFDGVIDGTLVLEKATYQVRGAKCSVNKAIFESATSITLVENMTGRSIACELPSGNARDTIRKLAERIGKLSKQLADQEKRIVELEQYMLPKDNGLF